MGTRVHLWITRFFVFVVRAAVLLQANSRSVRCCRCVGQRTFFLGFPVRFRARSSTDVSGRPLVVGGWRAAEYVRIHLNVLYVKRWVSLCVMCIDGEGACTTHTHTHIPSVDGFAMSRAGGGKGNDAHEKGVKGKRYFSSFLYTVYVYARVRMYVYYYFYYYCNVADEKWKKYF